MMMSVGSIVRRSLGLVAIGLLVLATHAQAGPIAAWTHGGGNDLWTNAGNWASGLPVAGDSAQFTDTGPGTVDLSGTATPTLESLAFSNSSGNNLNLINGTINLDSLV